MTDEIDISEIKTTGNQIFNVPNNAEGQAFLELSKKFLNKKIYKAKKRGRGHRKGRFSYHQDLPVTEAQWIAYYVNYTDRRIEDIVEFRNQRIKGALKRTEEESQNWRKELFKTNETITAKNRELVFLDNRIKNLVEQIEQYEKVQESQKEYQISLYNEIEELESHFCFKIKKFFHILLDFLTGYRIKIERIK